MQFKEYENKGSQEKLQRGKMQRAKLLMCATCRLWKAKQGFTNLLTTYFIFN